MDKFVFKQKIVEVLRFWTNPSRWGHCVRLFFSIVVFIVVAVVVVVDTDTDVAAVFYVWGVRVDVDGTAGQAHRWGESARADRPTARSTVGVETHSCNFDSDLLFQLFFCFRSFQFSLSSYFISTIILTKNQLQLFLPPNFLLLFLFNNQPKALPSSNFFKM